jgi:hypothetical protein
MVVRSKFTFLRLLAVLAIVTMALPVNPVQVNAAEPYTISGVITPAFSVASVRFNDGMQEWPGVIAADGLSYTISGLAQNASGTVIATAAAGYSISPETGYVGLVVTSDLMNMNFSGTEISYTISGNAGAAYAAIDFTGGTPVTADESGTFSLTVPYNWSGLVTPSLPGFVFTPANQEFLNLQADQPMDFTAEALIFTITGNAGVAGATFDFTGGSPVISDESGTFSFTVPFDWSGSVIPSLPGFIFSPASQDFANVQADQISGFSAAAATYTITGNTGAAATSIEFTGGDPVLTDVSGAYSISVPYNWSGMIVPSLSGYTFNPPGQNFDGVQANQTADFSPAAVTYTISGNAGVASAAVDFTGGTTVVTDATGAYSINVPYNWSGSVIPSLAGYVFNPASQDFVNVVENRIQDFAPASLSYSISGNTGVAAASIAFTGGNPVVADASGAYSITVPFNWSGSIVPSSPGYTFTPASQDFAGVLENKTQDFTAAIMATNTPIPTNVPTVIPTSLIAAPEIGSSSILRSVVTTSQESTVAAVGVGMYDDTSASIVYTGNWSYSVSNGHLNTTDHWSSNGSASLTFNGTQVDYYFPTYTNRGKVRVSIDGVKVTDIDLYSRRLVYQKKWTSPVLTPGVHTITISWLYRWIDLDGFVVYNNAGSPENPVITLTAVPNNTPTKTPTKIATNTTVPSYTPTRTTVNTATKTAIKTATKTAVPSFTPTKTAIYTATRTSLPSFTPTKTATKTATKTNTPTPIRSFTPTATSGTTGSTIFFAGFETGNYSEFTGKGEIFGKGNYYEPKIVTSPAIGNYATSLSISTGTSTAAYLFTYTVPSTPLGVYSADFYVPSNIQPSDWWNVWQWKSVDETYNKPIFHLNLLKDDNGMLQCVMFYTAGGINTSPDVLIAQDNPIAFPTDRWVHLTGYYMSKSDNTGYMEFYQDGVKIFDIRNIMTKPGNKNVLWSINSYASRISPDPATIYIDNMKIMNGG